MRAVCLLAVVFCVSTNALAQDSDRLDYELFVLPKIDLTYITHLSLRYNYTEALSSKVYFLHETYELAEELDGFPGSSREEKTQESILDLYFLEYSLNSLDDRLETLFGLSLDIFRQQSEEISSFDFQGAQESNNEFAVTFYSAKLEMENRFMQGRFAVDHHIEYVPIYFYSFDQSLSIEPLVSGGKQSNSHSDTSYPYIKNELTLTFEYFELEAMHEYQQIQFNLLNLESTSGGGYKLTPKNSSFTINNFTLLLNLRIPVMEVADVIVGAGMKFEKTHDSVADVSTRDRSLVLFNLGLSDPLFD